MQIDVVTAFKPSLILVDYHQYKWVDNFVQRKQLLIKSRPLEPHKSVHQEKTAQKRRQFQLAGRANKCDP